MARYSNSHIAQFDRCRLAYFYRYVKHLQKIDEERDAHHLVFGRAMHEAFRVLYTDRNVKLAQQALRDNYPQQLDPDDLAKTADNGCFVIEKYWEHYGGDPEWEIVECESMDSTDDDFTVKKDLLVKDRNDNLIVVDHKFTKRYLNFDFFADYDPNAQISHYIRQVKEKYDHCDGFIINAVRFAFLKRASKERPAGFSVEFERQVFNRTSSQIKRTQQAAAESISEIEHCKETEYWRPNEQPNACKFCSYRSLCAAGWGWDEDSELILNTFRSVCEKWMPDEGTHCNLNLNHSGDHAHELAAAATVEFVVEV